MSIRRLLHLAYYLLQKFKFSSSNWYTKRLNVSLEGNTDTLKFMKTVFNKESNFVYAEFGAYHGGTALEILKYFPNALIYIFDYDHFVQIMKENLKSFENRVNFFSNSEKFLYSYASSFSKLIASDKSLKFDYIFIDGAHTFAVDALIFFLAERSLKVGGYVDFDDYDWSIGTSSLKNNRIMKKMYTSEQFDERQIKFLVDNFVKGEKYAEVFPNKIFLKK